MMYVCGQILLPTCSYKHLHGVEAVLQHVADSMLDAFHLLCLLDPLVCYYLETCDGSCSADLSLPQRIDSFATELVLHDRHVPEGLPMKLSDRPDR